MDIYKFMKISIGTAVRNPEMLKFVPDHLKTKKISEHAVKKLPFVLRYDVPNQYKTQQLCNKAIQENGGTIESVSDSYKNQQICDKAVDNYPHALKSVPDCYMTRHCVIKLSILILLQLNMFLINLRLKKCVIKSLIDVFLYMILFPINIRLTKCVTEISEDPFLILYCPVEIKLKECELKLLMILKQHQNLFVIGLLQINDLKTFYFSIHNDIIYYNENSSYAIFSCNEMGILSIDLNNIDLDNSNYNEDDPETIIHVRLLA